MTAEDFRDLALSMQGATERAHMGHPDFRANGRIFCSLHGSDEWGTVKLTPEEQAELMRAHPRVFAPASGAWGRQGWTNVQLDAADTATVRGAVMLAWQNVVDQPRRQRAPAKPAARRRPSPARRPRRRT
jgi:hypothetical protein